MFSKVFSSLLALPPKFRVLVAANFIDRLGGTMLFPFFALYVTRRFNVGMTEAGILLGIFGLTGLIGSLVGGALADKVGRKNLIIFGPNWVWYVCGVVAFVAAAGFYALHYATQARFRATAFEA